MIRRIALIILLIVALSNLEVSFSNNYAFAAQPGQSCAKAGSTLTVTKRGPCKARASQSKSDVYGAPRSVEAPITIPNTHMTSDQSDTVTGFQIKAIYVVASDGVDHSYDTDGYIAGILDEGNKYLRTQLGLQVPIDRNAVGYDIQFLKSKLSTAHFLKASNLTDELLVESMVLETPSLNRKDYMFFIDVNNLKNGTACGYADFPGMSQVIAIGKGTANGAACKGKVHNFKNYAASVWPHELIHNFGVKHTSDTSCDLMSAGTTPCTSGGTLTIDKERTRYVGSSAQGLDILKLRVWEGYTQRVDLQANCSLNPVARADGVNYAYCPTGTQAIGAMKYCWPSINSVVLEEFINGEWENLGSGNHFSDPWGPNVEFKCPVGYTAPGKVLTVTTPGISLYRWMVDGSESELFKVIWVR